MALLLLIAATVVGLVWGFDTWVWVVMGMIAGYLTGQVVSYVRAMRIFRAQNAIVNEFFEEIGLVAPIDRKDLLP